VVYCSVFEVASRQLRQADLFTEATSALEMMRSALCSMISTDRAGLNLIDIPATMKRTDLYLSLFSLLRTLSYHKWFFTKPQYDEIVLTYQIGLSKWNTVTQHCVHSLVLCCFHCQPSTVKYLAEIIQRLSQVMTSPLVSVHLLEFLSILAHIPNLYTNFVETDFRRIFSIAIQYIQYHQRSLTERKSDAVKTGDVKPGSTANLVHTSFSQYVLTMAYHVLQVWFHSLRPSDRQRHISFILRGLLVRAQDPDGELSIDVLERLDEKIEVCLDTLVRMMDTGVKVVTESERSGKTKFFIVGHALVGVQEQESDWYVIVRRASGIDRFAVPSSGILVHIFIAFCFLVYIVNLPIPGFLSIFISLLSLFISSIYLPSIHSSKS
jgi:hypothetical protein